MNRNPYIFSHLGRTRRHSCRFLLAALLLAALGLATGASAAPVGTGFTYQGRLMDEGLPADGSYDLQFKLYDAAAGGLQLGSTVALAGIAAQDGRFTVELDFGTAAFGGGARWLEISLRPAGGGGYTLLSPRQELTPSPYALGMPNVYINEAQDFVGIGRDFQISGNEVFGVRRTGNANEYGGMYVETSDADGWPFYGYATNGSFRAWSYFMPSSADPDILPGWRLYVSGTRLTVPTTGGLRIGPAADYSLVIENTTGSDGIRVKDTGDDAIQIGSPPDVANYGVYIPSPGVSTYGLWSNTANASGQWALYSVDNIQAGNLFASAYTIVAKVNGGAALEPGDLAAAAGFEAPIPGGTNRLVQVQRASGATGGLVGVVASRMVYAVAPGKEAEGEMSMHSVEGAASSGDYVALIVLGVADVKLAPGASIAKGTRLTAADAGGAARPLRMESLNGMPVSEGAPVIGTALADAVPGAGTVPVFINLR
jgi:hypothetical protein